MDFSVKTIFKTLLGTITLMVVISLVIEIMNLQVTSLQLTQISRIACRQAAVLFSQETYKQRDAGAVAGGSVNMDASVAADGSTYVEGNFYGEGKTAEEIYTSIYTSSDFKNWMQSSPVTKGDWNSIKLINRALNGTLNLSMPANLSDTSAMQDYTDSVVAKAYKDVMMTPLNMGVPYLDEDVLEKMFRWNLAQMTSDCKPDAIRQDDSGNYCVFYKGFRVYADQATITNIEYETYDLDDMSDAQEFYEITHIDPDKLGFEDSIYLGSGSDDERKRVCLVGIEFNIPIGFEGITPIKSIFNFVWNNEVEGLDGNQGQDNHYQWNDSLATLESGGFEGNQSAAGTLPVPGKLIYYIVR